MRDGFTPEEGRLAGALAELRLPTACSSWDAVRRRARGREPRRGYRLVALSVAVAAGLAGAVIAGARLHHNVGVRNSVEGAHPTAPLPVPTPTPSTTTCRMLGLTQPTLDTLPMSRQQALDGSKATMNNFGRVLHGAVKLSRWSAEEGRVLAPGRSDAGIAPDNYVWVVSLSMAWRVPSCGGSIEMWYLLADGARLGTLIDSSPWPASFDRTDDLGEPSPPVVWDHTSFPMNLWLHCGVTQLEFDHRTWYDEDPIRPWGPKRTPSFSEGSPAEDVGTVSYVSPHELEFRDAFGNTGRFSDTPPAVVGKSYTMTLTLNSTGVVGFVAFDDVGWDVSGTLPPADRGDAGVEVTVTLLGPSDAQLRDPSGVTLHMVRRGPLMCA